MGENLQGARSAPACQAPDWSAPVCPIPLPHFRTQAAGARLCPQTRSFGGMAAAAVAQPLREWPTVGDIPYLEAGIEARCDELLGTWQAHGEAHARQAAAAHMRWAASEALRVGKQRMQKLCEEFERAMKEASMAQRAKAPHPRSSVAFGVDPATSARIPGLTHEPQQWMALRVLLDELRSAVEGVAAPHARQQRVARLVQDMSSHCEAALRSVAAAREGEGHRADHDSQAQFERDKMAAEAVRLRSEAARLQRKLDAAAGEAREWEGVAGEALSQLRSLARETAELQSPPTTHADELAPMRVQLAQLSAHLRQHLQSGARAVQRERQGAAAEAMRTRIRRMDVEEESARLTHAARSDVLQERQRWEARLRDLQAAFEAQAAAQAEAHASKVQALQHELARVKLQSNATALHARARSSPPPTPDPDDLDTTLELVEASAAATGAAQEVTMLRQALKQYTMVLQSRERERADCEARLEAAMDELQGTRAAGAAARAEIAARQHAVERVEARAQALEAEVRGLKEQLADEQAVAEQHAEAAQRRVEALEAQCHDAAVRLGDASASLADVETELTRARSENEQVSAREARTAAALDQCETARDEAQRRVRAAEARVRELQPLADGLPSLRAAVDAATLARNEAETTAAETARTLRDAQQQLEQLARERAAVEARLQDALAELASVQQDAAAAQHEAGGLRAALRQQVHETEQATTAAATAAAAAAAALEATKREVEMWRSNAGRATEELRSRLADAAHDATLNRASSKAAAVAVMTRLACAFRRRVVMARAFHTLQRVSDVETERRRTQAAGARVLLRAIAAAVSELRKRRLHRAWMRCSLYAAHTQRLEVEYKAAAQAQLAAASARHVRHTAAAQLLLCVARKWRARRLVRSWGRWRAVGLELHRRIVERRRAGAVVLATCVRRWRLLRTHTALSAWRAVVQAQREEAARHEARVEGLLKGSTRRQEWRRVRRVWHAWVAQATAAPTVNGAPHAGAAFARAQEHMAAAALRRWRAAKALRRLGQFALSRREMRERRARGATAIARSLARLVHAREQHGMLRALGHWWRAALRMRARDAATQQHDWAAAQARHSAAATIRRWLNSTRRARLRAAFGTLQRRCVERARALRILTQWSRSVHAAHSVNRAEALRRAWDRWVARAAANVVEDRARQALGARLLLGAVTGMVRLRRAAAFWRWRGTARATATQLEATGRIIANTLRHWQHRSLAAAFRRWKAHAMTVPRACRALSHVLAVGALRRAVMVWRGATVTLRTRSAAAAALHRLWRRNSERRTRRSWRVWCAGTAVAAAAEHRRMLALRFVRAAMAGAQRRKVLAAWTRWRAAALRVRAAAVVAEAQRGAAEVCRTAALERSVRLWQSQRDALLLRCVLRLRAHARRAKTRRVAIARMAIRRRGKVLSATFAQWRMWGAAHALAQRAAAEARVTAVTLIQRRLMEKTLRRMRALALARAFSGWRGAARVRRALRYALSSASSRRDHVAMAAVLRKWRAAVRVRKQLQLQQRTAAAAAERSSLRRGLVQWAAVARAAARQRLLHQGLTVRRQCALRVCRGWVAHSLQRRMAAAWSKWRMHAAGAAAEQSQQEVLGRATSMAKQAYDMQAATAVAARSLAARVLVASLARKWSSGHASRTARALRHWRTAVEDARVQQQRKRLAASRLIALSRAAQRTRLLRAWVLWYGLAATRLHSVLRQQAELRAADALNLAVSHRVQAALVTMSAVADRGRRHALARAVFKWRAGVHAAQVAGRRTRSTARAWVRAGAMLLRRAQLRQGWRAWLAAARRSEDHQRRQRAFAACVAYALGTAAQRRATASSRASFQHWRRVARRLQLLEHGLRRCMRARTTREVAAAWTAWRGAAQRARAVRVVVRIISRRQLRTTWMQWRLAVTASSSADSAAAVTRSMALSCMLASAAGLVCANGRRQAVLRAFCSWRLTAQARAAAQERHRVLHAAQEQAASHALHRLERALRARNLHAAMSQWKMECARRRGAKVAATQAAALAGSMAAALVVVRCSRRQHVARAWWTWRAAALHARQTTATLDRLENCVRRRRLRSGWRGLMQHLHDNHVRDVQGAAVRITASMRRAAVLRTAFAALRLSVQRCMGQRRALTNVAQHARRRVLAAACSRWRTAARERTARMCAVRRLHQVTLRAFAHRDALRCARVFRRWQAGVAGATVEAASDAMTAREASIRSRLQRMAHSLLRVEQAAALQRLAALVRARAGVVLARRWARWRRAAAAERSTRAAAVAASAAAAAAAAATRRRGLACVSVLACSAVRRQSMMSAMAQWRAAACVTRTEIVSARAQRSVQRVRGAANALRSAMLRILVAAAWRRHRRLSLGHAMTRWWQDCAVSRATQTAGRAAAVAMLRTRLRLRLQARARQALLCWRATVRDRAALRARARGAHATRVRRSARAALCRWRLWVSTRMLQRHARLAGASRVSAVAQVASSDRMRSVITLLARTAAANRVVDDARALAGGVLRQWRAACAATRLRRQAAIARLATVCNARAARWQRAALRRWWQHAVARRGTAVRALERWRTHAASQARARLVGLRRVLLSRSQRLLRRALWRWACVARTQSAVVHGRGAGRMQTLRAMVIMLLLRAAAARRQAQARALWRWRALVAQQAAHDATAHTATTVSALVATRQRAARRSAAAALAAALWRQRLSALGRAWRKWGNAAASQHRHDISQAALARCTVALLCGRHRQKSLCIAFARWRRCTAAADRTLRRAASVRLWQRRLEAAEEAAGELTLQRSEVADRAKRESQQDDRGSFASDTSQDEGEAVAAISGERAGPSLIRAVGGPSGWFDEGEMSADEAVGTPEAVHRMVLAWRRRAQEARAIAIRYKQRARERRKALHEQRHAVAELRSCFDEAAAQAQQLQSQLEAALEARRATAARAAQLERQAAQLSRERAAWRQRAAHALPQSEVDEVLALLSDRPGESTTAADALATVRAAELEAALAVEQMRSQRLAAANAELSTQLRDAAASRDAIAAAADSVISVVLADGDGDGEAPGGREAEQSTPEQLRRVSQAVRQRLRQTAEAKAHASAAERARLDAEAAQASAAAAAADAQRRASQTEQELQAARAAASVSSSAVREAQLQLRTLHSALSRLCASSDEVEEVTASMARCIADLEARCGATASQFGMPVPAQGPARGEPKRREALFAAADSIAAAHPAAASLARALTALMSAAPHAAVVSRDAESLLVAMTSALSEAKRELSEVAEKAARRRTELSALRREHRGCRRRAKEAAKELDDSRRDCAALATRVTELQQIASTSKAAADAARQAAAAAARRGDEGAEAAIRRAMEEAAAAAARAVRKQADTFRMQVDAAQAREQSARQEAGRAAQAARQAEACLQEVVRAVQRWRAPAGEAEAALGVGVEAQADLWGDDALSSSSASSAASAASVDEVARGAADPAILRHVRAVLHARQQDVLVLLRRVQDLQREASQAKSAAASLQEEVQVARRHAEQAREETQAARQATDRAAREAQAEGEQRSREVDRARAELDTLRGSVDAMRSDLTDAHVRLETAQRELRAAKAEAESQHQRAEHLVSTLEAARVREREQAATWQHTVQAQSHADSVATRQAANELAALQTAVRAGAAQLAATAQQLRAATEEREAWQQRAADAQAHCVQLRAELAQAQTAADEQARRCVALLR